MLDRFSELLRAAYSLFAQTEDMGGRRSVWDAGSIVLEALSDRTADSEVAEWVRTECSRRKGLIQGWLESVRGEWRNLLIALKVTSLPARFGIPTTLSRQDRLLSPRHGEDNTVTTGSVWPEYHIIHEDFLECSISETEKAVFYLYNSEDYDSQAGKLKADATSLCTSTVPLLTSTQLDADLSIIWTKDGHLVSAPSQRLC